MDDDEIVYCHEGTPSLHAFLASHMAAEEPAPRHIQDDVAVVCCLSHARDATAPQDLHMRNLEALAPPSAGGGDDTDPFASCYAFRHTPRDYCAYINGKSFGAVGVAGLAPAGQRTITREESS